MPLSISAPAAHLTGVTCRPQHSRRRSLIATRCSEGFCSQGVVAAGWPSLLGAQVAASPSGGTLQPGLGRAEMHRMLGGAGAMSAAAVGSVRGVRLWSSIKAGPGRPPIGACLDGDDFEGKTGLARKRLLRRSTAAYLGPSNGLGKDGLLQRSVSGIGQARKPYSMKPLLGHTWWLLLCTVVGVLYAVLSALTLKGKPALWRRPRAAGQPDQQLPYNLLMQVPGWAMQPCSPCSYSQLAAGSPGQINQVGGWLRGRAQALALHTGQPATPASACTAEAGSRLLHTLPTASARRSQ